MMKSASLPDFLTAAQIKQASQIWLNDHSHFHDRVLAEIVTPAMPEINRKLGQENDAGFIAYAIEYIFNQTLEGNGT